MIMAKKTLTDQKITLLAKKREVFGKKLKALRKTGILPANIYGEGFTSRSLTVGEIDFNRLFKKAGETHVVYAAIEGEAEEVPVLIHAVQRHPVTHSILHIDLRKVDLKKKLETEVPIKIIGESEAVAQSKGDMQTLFDSVLVEALPEEIPSEIEIDISVLKEVNDEIKVKDITATKDFTVKDDPEKVIVRITEHKEEELTPQTEAVETVITEEKAPEEGATEGEAAKPTDAEGKKEEEKPEAEEKPAA